MASQNAEKAAIKTVKLKVINGNLSYGGKLYLKGSCIEVPETEVAKLKGFAEPCNCGCDGKKKTAKANAQNKPCKNC